MKVQEETSNILARIEDLEGATIRHGVVYHEVDGQRVAAIEGLSMSEQIEMVRNALQQMMGEEIEFRDIVVRLRALAAPLVPLVFLARLTCGSDTLFANKSRAHKAAPCCLACAFS